MFLSITYHNQIKVKKIMVPHLRARLASTVRGYTNIFVLFKDRTQKVIPLKSFPFSTMDL